MTDAIDVRPTLRPEDWQQLRSRLRGDVSLPDDDGYALATPWNQAVRVRPAAVVAVADAEDVAEAVRWAAGHGLKVAVQLTGHGAADRGDDVLLIHTGRLDTLVVDSAARTATVGAGVAAERVLAAAGDHGLAPVTGATGSVGFVGYLSGGGIGPLASTLGLSSDYVRAFEVVTGDGTRRRVSATEEPELFWGLRGGRSRLGIITAVEVELLDIQGVYSGALTFAAADAAAVVRTWAEWSAVLPERATTSLSLLQLPDLPFLPPQIAGKFTVSVRFLTPFAASDEDEATRWSTQVLEPLRGVADPVLEAVGRHSYSDLSRAAEDPASSGPVRQDQALLSGLPPAAVDALLATAGPDSGSPLGAVEVRRLGGAFARTTPQTESSFSHRSAAFSVTAIGILVPPIAGAVDGAIRRVVTGLSPWSVPGHYANLVSPSGPEHTAAAYSTEALQRLSALASEVDPRGVLAD